MATQASTAEFLFSLVRGAGAVRIRKMFGEYALYCDEKVVALICDDRLFLKPTDSGRDFMGSPEEAPPYPGSKPYFVVEEDRWEDKEWMTELMRITASALPLKKSRRGR